MSNLPDLLVLGAGSILFLTNTEPESFKITKYCCPCFISSRSSLKVIKQRISLRSVRVRQLYYTYIHASCFFMFIIMHQCAQPYVGQCVDVAVLTEDGAFALFFRPHPEVFDSSRVPTSGNLPSKAKKVLMPGGQPGGALGAAGID